MGLSRCVVAKRSVSAWSPFIALKAGKEGRGRGRHRGRGSGTLAEIILDWLSVGMNSGSLFLLLRLSVMFLAYRQAGEGRGRRRGWGPGLAEAMMGMLGEDPLGSPFGANPHPSPHLAGHLNAMRAAFAGMSNNRLPPHLLFSDRDFNEDDYEALLALDDTVENRKGKQKHQGSSVATAPSTFVFWVTCSCVCLCYRSECLLSTCPVHFFCSCALFMRPMFADA